MADLIIRALSATEGDAYLISGADLGQYDNSAANCGKAGDGIIELADVAPLCFLKGTTIAVETAEVLAETLRIDDKMLTIDGKLTGENGLGASPYY